MNKALLTVSLCFSFFIFSSPQKVVDPVANIQKNCLGVNGTFYTGGVRIEDNSKSLFRFSKIASVLVDGASALLTSPSSLVQEGRKLLTGSRGTGYSKKVKTTTFLKNIVRDQKLNQEETLCLIKCAAANTLDYKENDFSKFGNENSIFSQGEGVCTEFSRVFDYYAGEFDIPSYTVEGSALDRNGKSRGGHSINKVQFDGSWYFMEPQSPRCTLYELN